MSQTTKLREIDAALASAFASVGLADAATYEGTPCTVLVDRNVELFGENLAGLRTIVTFFLADTPSLAVGSIVRLTATGEEFELSELVRQDESRSAWAVKRA